jgi:hypothetical protein
MAPGRSLDEVRIEIGTAAAVIVIAKFFETTAPVASVRLTATVKEPATSGVPEIVPVLKSIARPFGTVPLIDQTYGPIPPVFAIAAEYA